MTKILAVIYNFFFGSTLEIVGMDSERLQTMSFRIRFYLFLDVTHRELAVIF